MLKRSPHTFPQPPYTSAIPTHPNSSILASCPPGPARDCGRPAQAAPIHIGRPPAIHKKPQSPQSNISQAVHCSPCLADPHAPRIPIRAMFPYVFTAPPYSHQAPKIPPLVSTRPAFPTPQIRHPRVSVNSLRRLLARYRMSRRGTSSLRPAFGSLKPTPPSIIS